MQPIVRRSVLGAGAALPVLALAPQVSASRSVELPSGTPVRLAGTPHLFLVSESHPKLHWVGDTRALATHPVFWNEQKTWPYWNFYRWGGQWVGDPYLSTGLLKDGNPIYLVKWEQHWDEPQLYHIQSIKDVELFGINASNYGKFVLDRPAWEAEYGFEAAKLARYPLRAATWGSWRSREADLDFPAQVIYYDRVETPQGWGTSARVFLVCQTDGTWSVTVRLDVRSESWSRNYNGPVEVRSPIFSAPIAATSRGASGVHWISGQDFVAALTAVLHNAETTVTLTLHYPARGSESRELALTLHPAGIETAEAWLKAECAKSAA